MTLYIYSGMVSSFVQTRGSIPLFWQQKGKGIKPKPVVDVSKFAVCKHNPKDLLTFPKELGFQRHVSELVSLYGPQVLVSLIDQKGLEVEVGDAYETHVYLSDNARLRYVIWCSSIGKFFADRM